MNLIVDETIYFAESTYKLKFPLYEENETWILGKDLSYRKCSDHGYGQFQVRLAFRICRVNRAIGDLFWKNFF